MSRRPAMKGGPMGMSHTLAAHARARETGVLGGVTGVGGGGRGSFDGAAHAFLRERGAGAMGHARGDRTAWFCRRALGKTHNAMMAQMPVSYCC
jgi:hypothetical protein